MAETVGPIDSMGAAWLSGLSRCRWKTCDPRRRCVSMIAFDDEVRSAIRRRELRLLSRELELRREVVGQHRAVGQL